MIKNIELVLKGYGSLELESSLIEKFGLEIKYNITDISNFGSRRSNYSKSFNILGSPKNNKMLQHIYDINFNSNTFDLNAKQECYLMINKNIVMDGYMKIRSITNTFVANSLQIVYNVNIFDEIKDIFTTLGDLRLRDIKFSGGFIYGDNTYQIGNHTYNIANIVASQQSSNTYTNVYEYCIINWNYDGKDQGIYFPEASLDISMFYPSIYLKALVDRIFLDAGYTYTSDFFSGISYDGIFNNLVTLYNGEEMMSDNVLFYSAEVDATTTTYSNPYSSITEPTEDEEYVKTNMALSLIEETSAASDGTSVVIPTDGSYFVTLTNYVTLNTAGEDYPSYIQFNANGEVVEELDLYLWLGNEIRYVTLDLKAGDVLTVDFYMGITVFPSYYYGSSITITSSEMLIEIRRDITTKVGTTLDISDFLPDISQGEFLKGLFDQFNLYVYSDKLNSKNIYIEPRDTFYGKGNTLDWTEKIDEKSVKIEPLSKKIKRIYNFNMPKIETLDTERYIETYSINYGSKQIDVENEEFSGTNSINSKFGGYSFYETTANAGTINIPNLTKTVTDSIVTDKRAVSPMIGFIKSIDITPNVWELVDNTTSIINWNTVNHIATFGTTPTVYDINYETSPTTMYDEDSYSNFWQNELENMFDNNNRIVNYEIKLTIADIVNLDFKNPILIKGELYYLQSIVTDISGNNNSKIELIKAFDYVEYAPVFTSPFIYGLYDVGSVLPGGTARPTINTSLLDTGYSININTEEPFVLNVESNANQYVWFATPAESEFNIRNYWEVTEFNKGSIGGAINLGQNLFPDPIVLDYNSVEYYVYVANYQTELINPILKY